MNGCARRDVDNLVLIAEYPTFAAIEAGIHDQNFPFSSFAQGNGHYVRPWPAFMRFANVRSTRVILEFAFGPVKPSARAKSSVVHLLSG